MICKERLQTRGFEGGNKRNGSQVCDNMIRKLKLVLTIIGGGRWVETFMDVRTAYLQREEIKRIVNLKAPREGKYQREGVEE